MSGRTARGGAASGGAASGRTADHNVGDDTDTSRQGWRASRPELAIAALLVAAVALAGYAFAGAGAAAAVLIFTAGAGLLLLRGTAKSDAAPPHSDLDTAAELARWSFNGFFRKRSGVVAATTSLAGFDQELRGTLQHLLAARLAERHDISLYQDPDAARRALFPGDQGGDLWFWLDPGRPAASGTHDLPGIKPRALAILIERLERL